MAGPAGDQPPYWVDSAPRGDSTAGRPNDLPAYWDGGGAGSGAPPAGAPAPGSWGTPLPPEPARFSGLCAAAFAAGALSLPLSVHGGQLVLAPVLSVFAVLLGVAALLATSDEPLTNRWMAIVGLVAGLTPFALMYLLAAVFTRGLYGT